MRVLIFGASLLVLGAALGCRAFRPETPEGAGGASAPTASLELVETVPVETSLEPRWSQTHVAWLDMIEGAETRIDLAHFYASNRLGSRLETVVCALENAADRGVQVRFLADERFYGTYPETLDRLAARAGIEVRRFDMRPLTDGVQHAKYMVVDGYDALLGSANFDWRSLEHILELGVRLRSPGVAAALTEAFEWDWALAAGADPAELPPRARDGEAERFPIRHRFGDDVVRVTPVFSPTGLLPDADLWDLPRLVRWIDRAETDISVQLLTYRSVDRDGGYFTDLENALRSAAARGVRVRLLLADWGKRPGTIEGLKSLTVLPKVEVRLVTLPEASEGFIPYARVIQAKYMVVDRRQAWIGTGNWSADYFYKSRNVGVLIQGESVARELDELFTSLWNGEYAYAVDPSADYVPPRVSE